jgi:hypothetical protein
VDEPRRDERVGVAISSQQRLESPRARRPKGRRDDAGATARVQARGSAHFESAHVAWAAIPNSSTGVINACYGKSGAVRVIDAQAGASCAKGEQSLTWNQQGEQGPPGAPGEKGETGDQGDQGLPGVPGASGISHV